MRKIYKKIKQKDGRFENVIIYGSNRPIKLRYAQPDWSDEEEAYFNYQGTRHYLSEFMTVGGICHSNPPEWMKEFDGVTYDTYFSGILIKWGSKDFPEESECIRAFTYL